MHQRARGHEVEPKNSHFLCPKTKRNKTRERGATGESHAPTCKRTRGRACNSHFFMSKNKKKQNKGERRNWGESCTNVQEDTRQSTVNPIFLCPKTKRSKTREKGATGESHAPTCKRTRGRAQSLPFFILNNRKKLQSENTGALYAIL